MYVLMKAVCDAMQCILFKTPPPILPPSLKLSAEWILPVTDFPTHSGDFLVAGVGQEHKFGRWWKDRTARNSIVIIPLQKLVYTDVMCSQSLQRFS